MSVWSHAVPAPSPLVGTEGALVSVSIAVEASRLEALLDALAYLDFPINPQICHDVGASTLIEFPAYENRLSEIRGHLDACGFRAESVTATPMLDSIRGCQAAATA